MPRYPCVLVGADAPERRRHAARRLRSGPCLTPLRNDVSVSRAPCLDRRGGIAEPRLGLVRGAEPPAGTREPLGRVQYRGTGARVLPHNQELEAVPSAAAGRYPPRAASTSMPRRPSSPIVVARKAAGLRIVDGRREPPRSLAVLLSGSTNRTSDWLDVGAAGTGLQVLVKIRARGPVEQKDGRRGAGLPPCPQHRELPILVDWQVDFHH